MEMETLLKTKPFRNLPTKGDESGRLKVKSWEILLIYGRKETFVRCDCKCGTKDILVLYKNFRFGTSKSCGCLRSEATAQRNRERTRKAS